MIVCTATNCQLHLVTKFVDSQLPDKDQDLTAKRSEPIKSCIYNIYIYVYMWEDRSQKVNNDEPNLRIFTETFDLS